MSDSNRQEAERVAKRLNGFFHALFGAWLGATAVFWLQAWGPMRSYASEQAELPVLAWFLASVFAGLSSIFLPNSYYALRNPSDTVRFYECLGILRLRYWITDGDFVRLRARRIDRGYVVDGSRRSLAARLEMTRKNERAHFGFLLFGLVTAVAASIAGWWGWTLLISIGNLAVNLLPIFLQRYTRARVVRLMKRRDSTAFP